MTPDHDIAMNEKHLVVTPDMIESAYRVLEESGYIEVPTGGLRLVVEEMLAAALAPRMELVEGPVRITP